MRISLADVRGIGVVAPGAVAALIVVSLMLSFPALIFSGPLNVHLAVGTSIFLGAAAVMNLIAARWSSLPGSVVAPQDTATAVLSVTVGAAIANTAADDLLATALVMVGMSTMLTALAMLGLGFGRLGRLVRYVPLPVMGGFLAGTGWLLVAGSVELMSTDVPNPGVRLASVLGGLAIGLVLTLLLRRRPSAAVFPSVIGGSVAVFVVALLITGTGVSEARRMGVLAAVGDGGSAVLALGSVDWAAVGAALPGLVTVPLVATIALLLNVAGLETVAGRDADLDRELRVAGAANLFGGLLGVPAGYHTLGASAVPYRVGVSSRGVPVLTAAACVAALIGGDALIGILPVPIIGGVLAMLGFSFLADWLIDAAPQMQRHEYLVMLVIVVLVAIWGFLPAVLFGMAAAITIFAVRYSRIDPIRHTFTGEERSSSVERGPAARAVLAEQRPTIRVVELQGFMFFGTAHTALLSIGRLVTEHPARFLIVDMRRVSGADATAIRAFGRLVEVAEAGGFRLVFSHVPETSRAVFDTQHARGRAIVAPNLDHALQWCETELLHGIDAPAERFLPDELWLRLTAHGLRRAVSDGEVLADFGEDGNSLFIIESGRVAAELPLDDGRWERVRSVNAGNVVGEFSVYGRRARSARLTAEGGAVVHQLDMATIAELEQTDPECAIAFHRAIAGVLAERLISSNDFIRGFAR